MVWRLVALFRELLSPELRLLLCIRCSGQHTVSAGSTCTVGTHAHSRSAAQITARGSAGEKSGSTHVVKLVEVAR